MQLTELATAVKNAKQIFQKIKKKYPQIRAYLILSTRFGQAPIDSSYEFLLDDADHFFIENEAVKEVWRLLDKIWDLNESLRENRRYWPQSLVQQTESKIESLRQSYLSLIPSVEIADEVEICLRWDEIDYDINRQLGVDAELVDVSRSNAKIGGIKICLGTISNLAVFNPE